MTENQDWLSSFTNRHFELIILVTEQCNFRCVYCYEDFKLGKIDPEVVLGIKNLISNKVTEVATLTLSFFGGEPLLNKAAVFDLSDWAKETCSAFDVGYAASMTTNGYSLDAATFEHLIQVGVKSFQVTLDGEKESHDKLRPTINGKATFDKIYGNLIQMANSEFDFSCTLRFNISDLSLSSVKSFIENFSSPFCNDPRFRFHFHPIFGVPALRLTTEKPLNELKEMAQKKGFSYATPSDFDTCYASRADSFVIRADGVVQKCTVALNSEMNKIGRIHRDGRLTIDQEKFKKWILADNKGCPLQSILTYNH